MRCALLTTALLAACTGQRVGVLPELVIVSARTRSGEYVSALIELPRPGSDAAVALAPGVLAVGAGWAHHARISAEGLSLLPADGDPPHTTPLAPGARIVQVDRDGVVVESDGQWVQLRRDGQQATLPAAPVPGGLQEWRGPFDGFSITKPGDTVQLMLPRAEGVGTPIMHDVDAVLGSWWLRARDLPGWEQQLLRERFRQIDVIVPEPGHARIDGDLREWAICRAVPVDHVSQVTDGLPGWSSERDGSFGVALRVEDGEARMAVRIRDDEILPDRDHLKITIDEDTYDVFVPERGSPIEHGDGWRAASAWRGFSSVVLEIAIEAPGAEQWRHAPISIEFVDVDSGEETSTISSAPWPELLEIAAANFTATGAH